MEIGKVNVYGGNANFAERVESIVFNQNSGMSKEEFGELMEALKGLGAEQKSEAVGLLKEAGEAKTEEAKEGIWQRIKTFLVKNGVPVAQSLTASVICEIGKGFL